MPNLNPQPQAAVSAGNMPNKPPQPQVLAQGDQPAAGRELNMAQNQSRRSNEAATGNTNRPGPAPKATGLGSQSGGMGQQLGNIGPTSNQPQQANVPEGKQDAVKRTLDQQLMQSRKSAITQPKEFAKEVIREIGKKGTAEALKQSWLNLIDSYGLTFLYIDLHFLGKYIANSRFFCDFGEEWTSGFSGPGAAGGMAGGEGAEQMIPRGRGVMIAELIAVIGLNLLLFGAIMLILVVMLAPFAIAGGTLIWIWETVSSAWNSVKSAVGL